MLFPPNPAPSQRSFPFSDGKDRLEQYAPGDCYRAWNPAHLRTYLDLRRAKTGGFLSQDQAAPFQQASLTLFYRQACSAAKVGQCAADQNEAPISRWYEECHGCLMPIGKTMSRPALKYLHVQFLGSH